MPKTITGKIIRPARPTAEVWAEYCTAVFGEKARSSDYPEQFEVELDGWCYMLDYSWDTVALEVYYVDPGGETGHVTTVTNWKQALPEIAAAHAKTLAWTAIETKQEAAE